MTMTKKMTTTVNQKTGAVAKIPAETKTTTIKNN